MQTRPLTVEQSNRLRVNSLLPVGVTLTIVVPFSLVLGAIFVTFPNIPILRMFSLVGIVLLLLVLLAVTLHIRNNLLDLKDGVCQIITEKLTQKRETGRAPKSFYGDFEQTGSLVLAANVYQQLEVGVTYQVSFSPRTRLAWDVKAPE